MAAEYRIELTEREFVVRMRRDFIGREEVSRFLDRLELESIRRRSHLSEADAALLADEIDRAVWARARSADALARDCRSRVTP